MSAIRAYPTPLKVAKTSVATAALITALASAHGVTLPLDQQANAFLRSVWSAMPAGQLVGITASDSYEQSGVWKSSTTPIWTWIDDFRAGDSGILDWAQERNTAQYPIEGSGSIYFHPASRKLNILQPGKHKARGGLDDLTYVTSFWCDWDADKHGHDLETGLDLLLKMQLPPSAVIATGGGLQAWHFLSEAWSVPNRAACEEYKDFSLALYRSTFNQAGLTLDTSVHESSREMRLPQFINRKPGRGQTAQLVYWNPDTRYSVQDIRDQVVITPRRVFPKPVLSNPSPNGTYQVSQDFRHYLIDGNKPVERHPLLLKVSLEAARAGIPQAEYQTRLEPIARAWFPEEPHRAEGELTNLINWAYQRIQDDPDSFPRGGWLVKLNDQGFEVAASEVLEKFRDRTVTLDNTLPTPVTQDLAQVRTEQAALIQNYIKGKLPGRMGTYLLLRTSPGAGKTYAALSAVQEVATGVLTTGAKSDSNQSAVLTLFKAEETNWQQYVLEQGGDPGLFNYLVGRNGELGSQGYCEHHKLAETVGQKNYNIVGTLCSRCPLKETCSREWYLSQFQPDKLAEKPILLARHSHGMMQNILEHRKVIVFDESPLDIVAGALVLGINDLVFYAYGATGGIFLQDQYPGALGLIHDLVTTLRQIVAGNTPLPKTEKGQEKLHPSLEHVRLGGRWLFEQLARLLGDKLAQVFEIDPAVIEDATRHSLPDISDNAVRDLPINWIHATWLILKHEYLTYWQENSTGWNSRIIVWANTLRVYPMQPFKLTQDTKILITDATGLPELYGSAFSYSRQQDGEVRSLPRLGMQYDGRLTPHATVTQFTGTDHSKNDLSSKRARVSAKTERVAKLAAALTLKLSDGTAIQFNGSVGTDPSEPSETENTGDENTGNENEYLKKIQALIYSLAVKHEQSLLVVSYKNTVTRSLQRWNKKHQVLPETQIQWYGNLRGKNDYKHLNAVVLIGTHRLPPMELLALAQVWHWQDPLPVSGEQTVLIEPYAGYRDPVDKIGRGYKYVGYVDARVNQLMVGLAQAEMRQCYERIRPNASTDESGNPIHKHVYIASAFPCADHVDVLIPWAGWWVDYIGRKYYEERIAAGLTVYQTDFIKHVMLNTECSWDTGKAAFTRLFEEKKATLQGDPGMRKLNKEDAVIEWLNESPDRAGLSVREIHKALPHIGIATISRALSKNKRSTQG